MVEYTKKEKGNENMGNMGKTEECYIPITIEKRLKAYAECTDHIERHEVLWHEWNHNKRWLIQIQELILPSFPSYSRHDVSHSEAVIHNIEMLLGEENIRALSATDCFVLLHTVYIHDIGMCITHEDREKILKNEKFQEYLEGLANGADSELSYYAKVLLQECFHKNNSTKSDKQYILKKKLEVYYAITYLIGEFRRKEHGEVSKERLITWIDDPNKLGVGFSTVDIPNRLFYIIANCAVAHTNWDFEEILKLRQEDSGFVLDYVHPRFIAVLLQLGDALDMDNNRFHPLTEEFLGKIPEESSIHWRKHKAIRRLRITNEKISISADCKNQEEMRIVRMECDAIQDILKNATFCWSVIKPRNSKVCLPTLDNVNILLNGESISLDLVKAQFEISQEKAFNLIIGNNIYTEQNFVFLRELLQNAVDATKIQYFREYNRKIRRDKRQEILGTEKLSLISPTEMVKTVSPQDFPIDIELAVKKRLCSRIGVYEDITQSDMDDPGNNLEGYECGVLVRITDYGTGISEQDIKLISNVGSSYETRKEAVKKMPQWLQPTGTFGIGLQSVFLAGKVLKAFTYAMNSEPYEIIFYPRQEGKKGYINVTPRKVEDINAEPFGSCFEVFVPHEKKKLHKENPETWDGSDPFRDGYEESKAIRHSRELLKQMALYIGKIVGEPLFPVKLKIQDCEIKEKDNQLYSESFLEKFNHLNIEILNPASEDSEEKEEKELKITWAYNFNKNENTHKDEASKNIYKLDCENAKLCVWNQKYNTYACFGIDRIMEIRKRINSPDEQLYEKREGVDVYYKGVLMTATEFKEDADLMEYMDIKETLGSDYLKLSRKGFSKRGYEYLNNIYRELIKTAREALYYFGKEKAEKFSDTTVGRLWNRIEGLKEGMESAETEFKKKCCEDKLEKVLLSSAALIYFAMVCEKDEVYRNNLSSELNQWKELLTNILSIATTKKIKECLPSKQESALYNIPLYKYVCITTNRKIHKHLYEDKISIFEVVNSEKKYMIISERDKKHLWEQKLIEIDNVYHEKIKRMIQELRSESSLEKREKLIEKLKDEIREYEQYPKTDSLYSYQQRHKEQVILEWILDNIPTMAIFASDHGDLRINVLDVDICDSVYYDLEMKKLTIKRIEEKAKRIRRFSVPVWSGYSLLSLSEPRDSVMFIKRGKLSKVGYGEMIFPLTGEELEKELKIDDKNPVFTELNTKIEAVKSVYENTIYQAAQYLSLEDKSLYNRFIEQVKTYLYEEKEYSSSSKQMSFDKNILDKIKIACESEENSPIWESEVAPTVQYLRNEFLKYITKEVPEVEKNLAQRMYEEYCLQKKEYENIRDYICLHGKMRTSHPLIDSLYRKYMQELARIIIEIIQDSLWENFEEIDETYDILDCLRKLKVE